MADNLKGGEPGRGREMGVRVGKDEAGGRKGRGESEGPEEK